jgi:N-acetylglucosaminyldiphosphoundecaprenol N-acetyl-beta-D-mannosaminyltransferase
MLDLVATSVTARTPTTIFYANAHAVTLAESDRDFAAAMNQADTVFCDGFGAYVASRLLGAPLPERFSWPDWITPLGQTCRDNGSAMFLLGAREGVAAEAARRMERAVPGLRVFAHHGHFPKDDASSRAIVDLVNRSGADVLLVGFGMPLQELWINRYRRDLAPHVVFANGATFDYVAGNVWRGPDWLTRHGFEWLTRLVVEPRRLAKRYLIGLPEFALLVARQKLGGVAAARRA